MDGIRAKITPYLHDGLIGINIEWVNIVNEQPGEVVAREEFRTDPEKEFSYVSKISFIEGVELPGTFYLNKDGKRNFVISVDTGNIKLIGGNT